MRTALNPPEPSLPNEEPDLVFRWATARGDVVVTWKKDTIHIDGTLATDKERDKIEAWAREYDLKIGGELAGPAVVKTTTAMCKCALEGLLSKQVGDAGYLVYVVDKKGKGKVLQSKHVDLAGVKQAAKVPQVRGG